MADINNDGEETTAPPPTEEERQTETVNDDIKPQDSELQPEPSQPDVSARLDAIEQDIAAIKAMMDTLGYDDAAPSDNDDDGDDDETQESIEDLFD